MIFVDANYFIRAVTVPVTPVEQAMAEMATGLFQLVERGEEEITTSEAVLAEVAYILSGKRHYRPRPAETGERLKPILLLHGFRLPTKRICLRALDRWATFPRLDFVDVLGAAYAEVQATRLASFDADFDRLPGIVRWNPAVDGSESL
ncbi:MAG: type II toxin-antitoxin system VapC family toxin [Thermomicrobiales bacterium]